MARLQALGFLALADSWEDVVALVTTKRWSFTQAIEHVVALEEGERARRGLERRQRRSKLERYKPMADFDWNWPDQVDRPLVESALVLDFLPAHRNIVLVAAKGWARP